MQYISIQGTEKQVSNLVMGSDWFRPDTYERFSKMLDDYFAIGGNAIDTAYIYCGGESEKMIGRWMQERGNRNDVVVLTKGAHHNKDGPRVNKQAIDEELTTSLDRLQTDHVELYALHRDDVNIPVAHIMEALNEHKQAGRIGLWEPPTGPGSACRKRMTMLRPTARGIHLQLSEPEPRQAERTPLGRLRFRRFRNPALARSQAAAAAVLVLASGRLLLRTILAGCAGQRRDGARLLQRRQLGETAPRGTARQRKKGVTPIQIALAYVLNQPFPTCALIGPQTAEELESCNEGAGIRLTAEELKWLDLSAE